MAKQKKAVSISTSKTFWPTEGMKKVVVHSDGGCHGNPGPGGWAAILKYGAHARELSGGVPATTNNRMELQAAIEALSALKEPCEVEFYTDSEYVKNGVSAWLSNWKRNGWRTKSKKPVKNEDLWRALDSCSFKHRVKWHWLKGHAGDIGNERCDQLANAEIAKIKKTFNADQLKTSLVQFSAKLDDEQTADELFEN
jgi:ribonuclease HI